MVVYGGLIHSNLLDYEGKIAMIPPVVLIMNDKKKIMDILTLGWVSLFVLFTWSIAMVVWARSGF